MRGLVAAPLVCSTLLVCCGQLNAQHEHNNAVQLDVVADGQARPVGQPQNTLDDLLLFFPSKFPQGNWNPQSLQFEDVWITSQDGTRIHAWYCPAEDPRAHVLYSHGNAGNISHRSRLLLRLQRMGITTLAFDYRGYGRSEGLPSKDGIVDDAAASGCKLAALAGIAESDIVLMGRSLGGAVSIQLAARKPVRGLIVESTFSSLADVAKYHYPNLAWLVNPDSLNSAAVLPNYKGPLLLSHGDADRTIPFGQGRELFRVANDPKEFLKIRGGGHNSPQPSAYYDAVSRFIDSL